MADQNSAAFVAIAVALISAVATIAAAFISRPRERGRGTNGYGGQSTYVKELTFGDRFKRGLLNLLKVYLILLSVH